MDRATQIAIERGLILQGLDLEYPDGMSDSALRAMLQGGGSNISRFEMLQDLEYLAGTGKEFIALEKKSRELWIAKLTPKGKDFIAGAIEEDPGVRVAR